MSKYTYMHIDDLKVCDLRNCIDIEIFNYEKAPILIHKKIAQTNLSEIISILQLLDMSDKSYINIRLIFNNKVLMLTSNY